VSPVDELLEMWQERGTAHLARANGLGASTIGGRLEIAEAAVLDRCVAELRYAHLAAGGELAPLPGQVLDDQTVDALDRRYAELEARVDALERAVSQ
jgi:hypothetical protein